MVTGGSSGLGRAMSLAFAAEGAHVVVGDIRTEPREGGEPTVDVIAAAGGSAEFVHADVSSWEDVDRLVATATARTGRLDVMVPQRGASPAATRRGCWRPSPRTGRRSWPSACAACSCAASEPCSRCSSQEPIAEARGRIINISSQHGMVGPPGHVAYAAAKGGVVNLTRQVAVDFGPRGIIVNAIAPGKILTAPSTSPTPPRSWPTRTPARRSRGLAGPRTWPRRRSSWPRTSAPT